jgi:hypothetical protein
MASDDECYDYYDEDEEELLVDEDDVGLLEDEEALPEFRADHWVREPTNSPSLCSFQPYEFQSKLRATFVMPLLKSASDRLSSDAMRLAQGFYGRLVFEP